MSKLARDVVNEFHSLDVIEDDFELFVLSVKINDYGEIISTESIEPVSRVESDNENQECLLHISPSGEPLKICEAVGRIGVLNPDYALCAAQEETIDNSWVRIDNPIIGFGENLDLKRFFVVCQA